MHAVKPEAIVSDQMPKRRFFCMILSPYKERELLRLFYSRLIILSFTSSNVRLGKFAVSLPGSSRRPPAASGRHRLPTPTLIEVDRRREESVVSFSSLY